MTDFSFSDVSSDISTDVEDEPTVTWIDQTISDAEQSGFLSELASHVSNDSFSDPQAFAASVEQARDEGLSSSEDADHAASVPPTRDEIREAIFAKLRRPDGTPFGAGYVSGPAARKAIYEGEDVRNGAWRSGAARANLDTRTTRYEDRATLDERAVQHDEGFVVDKDGYAISGNFGWVIDDQTGALLLFDPNDNEFFTPDGTPYAKPEWVTQLDLIKQGYRVRGIHHTTPVAGMPVTGAGMIEIDHGRILKITDESGHYRPDAAQQHQAVSSLAEQGYDLGRTDVRLTGNDMTGRPTDKAEWINAAAATNADFPTGNVDLQAAQFLQTEGDEYQARMKQALNQQISDRDDQPGTQFSTSPNYNDRDPDDWSSVSEDDSSFSDDDDDGSVGLATSAVAEGEIVDNGSRRQLRVTYEDRNYTLFDMDDEDAPEVPDDLLVVDRAYARTAAGGWERTTRFQSGRVALEGVSEGDVPAAIKRAAPAPNVGGSVSGDEDGDSAAEDLDDTDDDTEQGTEQGTTSSEQSEADSVADSVAQARTYLQAAGHAAFATWLRTLPQYAQDTLLADPELAAAWRRENAAPQPPAWQPAEAHWAAAADANAAYVDTLDDRGTANYTVAGLSLIIGGGHDEQHAAWVGSAADRSVGTVTVRKSGIGRGAGSLTFTGVPPAKQEIVRASVARFSRKEVRFG